MFPHTMYVSYPDSPSRQILDARNSIFKLCPCSRHPPSSGTKVNLIPGQLSSLLSMTVGLINPGPLDWGALIPLILHPRPFYPIPYSFQEVAGYLSSLVHFSLSHTVLSRISVPSSFGLFFFFSSFNQSVDSTSDNDLQISVFSSRFIQMDQYC